MTEATPFSSAEWARAWWTHWAGAGDAVRRHGPRRRPAGGPGAAGACAPRAVPRADRARPPAQQLLGRAVRAGRARGCRRRWRCGRCSTHSDEWHALLLGGVRTGSATERAVLSGGLRLRRRQPTPYPGIELPATFDEYLAGLPRKRRKDLRRHLRRLDDGRLELRDVTRARRPERDHRPLAGHPRALVAAPRQAHGPRARQHPVSRLHAGARGPDGAARTGPGVGAAPRRRGGRGRGEPHRQPRLLLLDGRLRPRRLASRPRQARDRREHPGEHRGGARVLRPDGRRRGLQVLVRRHGPPLPLDHGRVGPAPFTGRAGRRRAADRARRAGLDPGLAGTYPAAANGDLQRSCGALPTLHPSRWSLRRKSPIRYPSTITGSPTVPSGSTGTRQSSLSM